MEKAYNPSTGEVVFLVNNQWVKPTDVAENPKTGERAYLVNNQWEIFKPPAQQQAAPAPAPAPAQPASAPRSQPLHADATPDSSAAHPTQPHRRITNTTSTHTHTLAHAHSVHNGSPSVSPL